MLGTRHWTSAVLRCAVLCCAVFSECSSSCMNTYIRLWAQQCIPVFLCFVYFNIKVESEKDGNVCVRHLNSSTHTIFSSIWYIYSFTAVVWRLFTFHFIWIYERDENGKLTIYKSVSASASELDSNFSVKFSTCFIHFQHLLFHIYCSDFTISRSDFISLEIFIFLSNFFS